MVAPEEGFAVVCLFGRLWTVGRKKAHREDGDSLLGSHCLGREGGGDCPKKRGGELSGVGGKKREGGREGRRDVEGRGGRKKDL